MEARMNDSLRLFLTEFPCLPAPPRPNTLPRLSLGDASQPPLRDSPSPLKPSAWAALLRNYPGPLGVHLTMILRFGVEIGYKGPRDVLILSKNLASAMEDPSIIDSKLEEDIHLQRVAPVANPTLHLFRRP